MKKEIIKNAIIDSGATALYILIIATFLNKAEVIFKNQTEDGFLAPVIMLLLLVISAGITGFAVFGKPLMWYLDGKKKEAINLIGFTFLFLVIIFIFFISIILI